jgi:hypothetical protein
MEKKQRKPEGLLQAHVNQYHFQAADYWFSFLKNPFRVHFPRVFDPGATPLVQWKRSKGSLKGFFKPM